MELSTESSQRGRQTAFESLSAVLQSVCYGECLCCFQLLWIIVVNLSSASDREILSFQIQIVSVELSF